MSGGASRLVGIMTNNSPFSPSSTPREPASGTTSRGGFAPSQNPFGSTPRPAESDPLTQGLNPQQLEAVTHTGRPLLIVAGAGSGKTAVLTRRIAYLMRHRGVNPWEILAITFTNKAAAEMKERVGSLVGPVAERMWVSTFHSICVRILRQSTLR